MTQRQPAPLKPEPVSESELMTVGELALCSGLSRKAIRELEGLGLAQLVTHRGLRRPSRNDSIGTAGRRRVAKLGTKSRSRDLIAVLPIRGSMRSRRREGSIRRFTHQGIEIRLPSERRLQDVPWPWAKRSRGASLADGIVAPHPVRPAPMTLFRLMSRPEPCFVEVSCAASAASVSRMQVVQIPRPPHVQRASLTAGLQFVSGLRASRWRAHRSGGLVSVLRSFVRVGFGQGPDLDVAA
jgi:hypothetical protein